MDKILLKIDNIMSNLQELCYDKLVQSIISAPPLIQDIIIGKTYRKIRDNMKNDAKITIYNTLPYMLTEIMQDIIDTMTEGGGRVRRNFREEYKHLEYNLVECAIKTAEDSVGIMEDRYARKNFPSYISQACGDSDSDSD